MNWKVFNRVAGLVVFGFLMATSSSLPQPHDIIVFIGASIVFMFVAYLLLNCFTGEEEKCEEKE